MRQRACLAVLCAVLSLTVAPPVLAHEERTVGALDVECGWLNEPPTVGELNSILFSAKKGAHPVTNGKVTVAVTFGGRTSQPLDMEPSDEAPRTYLAAIIPTDPGSYTFHVTGAIAGEAFDQTFAPGKGVEEVGAATDLEFPRH